MELLWAALLDHSTNCEIVKAQKHMSYPKLSGTGLKYWMLNLGSSGGGQSGVLECTSVALVICVLNRVLNIWTPFKSKVEKIGTPLKVIYVSSSPITLKTTWSTRANVNIYSVKCLVKWFLIFLIENLFSESLFLFHSCEVKTSCRTAEKKKNIAMY